MKQRLQYYDNARGILILLVVAGHLLTYANPNWDIKPYVAAHAYITSFHMPAFFLLSGMLFDTGRWKMQTWSAFLGRRIRTLVVPYLFFELSGLVYLRFVLHSVSIREGLLRILRLECNVGANWFLPAMFFASLLFFACIKLLYGNRNGRIICGLLAAVGLFSSWFIPTGIVGNQLIRALLGFGFLYFGNLLRGPLNAHTPLRMVLAFLLSVIFAILTLFFASNDFFTCRVTIPPLFLLCGLVGLYLVLGIAKQLHCKLLALLGENSIVIMGTHQLVLYTVPRSSSVLWIVCIFTLILVIEAPLILVLRHVCPFCIGKSRRQSQLRG